MTNQTFDDFRAVLTAAAGSAYTSSFEDLPTLFTSLEMNGAVWVSPDVPAEIISRLENADFDLRTNPSPTDTRDQPWGLSMAHAAVAETGSVILHENRLETRSVSLMTESLVVLCPLDQLVPSLDDAANILRQIASDGSSYATLVSGPSRTADIERQLTIGVQGPGALHVVFLTDKI